MHGAAGLSAAAELKIGGFAPLSTCDWPGQLAATVFCQGCAWDCVYCHNAALRAIDAPAVLLWSDVVDLLRRRRGLLDAVVFSGGEPTLQPALIAAMDETRALGFRIGLHTAGMMPERFADALSRVDWVGFDVKAPFDAYAAITGVSASGERAQQSLRMLLASGVDYEVRTTVHSALLNAEAVTRLREELLALGVRHYAAQNYRSAGVAQDRISPVSMQVSELLPENFGEGFLSFTLR